MYDPSTTSYNQESPGAVRPRNSLNTHCSCSITTGNSCVGMIHHLSTCGPLTYERSGMYSRIHLRYNTPPPATSTVCRTSLPDDVGEYTPTSWYKSDDSSTRDGPMDSFTSSNSPCGQLFFTNSQIGGCNRKASIFNLLLCRWSIVILTDANQGLLNNTSYRRYNGWENMHFQDPRADNIPGCTG